MMGQVYPIASRGVFSALRIAVEHPVPPRRTILIARIHMNMGQLGQIAQHIRRVAKQMAAVNSFLID